MTRPIYATVSPSAIAHNLTLAKSKAAGVFTWAVVKANAYGHGIERVYSGLSAADGLAMLDFEEAKRVRALGWGKPILMLEGLFEPSDAALCHSLGLTPVVHQFRQLEWLAAQPAPSPVFIKVNSGMNRLGFAMEDLPALAQWLEKAPQIQIQSWMTHFANADAAPTDALALSAAVQQNRFECALNELFETHPRLVAPVSLANSAATLRYPLAHGGSIRAGIMLYGSSPFAHVSAQSLDLCATMQLRSEIIAVQRLRKGDAVGYGSTFIAPNDMRLGIVACGYADGYPRHAPTGTPIAVDGVVTRIVGRVSMDMLTVDLSPIASACEGSAVELWGDTVPVDEVASASGTIAYELMCALAPRVPIRVALS